MVTIPVPRISKLSGKCRTNMPLLRSLGMTKGALAAIDMALLWSLADLAA